MKSKLLTSKIFFDDHCYIYQDPDEGNDVVTPDSVMEALNAQAKYYQDIINGFDDPRKIELAGNHIADNENGFAFGSRDHFVKYAMIRKSPLAANQWADSIENDRWADPAICEKEYPPFAIWYFDNVVLNDDTWLDMNEIKIA